MPGEVPLLQIVQTLADLKALNPSANQNALLIGKSTLADGLGGFYRWDTTDTTSAEDTQFMNVVPSTVGGASGRWVRVFQKAKVYPEGIMVTNGGVKTLYCPVTTDASGKATVYPTSDGTVGGSALFTEVWQLNGTVNSAAATASNVIVGSGNISADMKTVSFTFAKSNSTTLGGTLLTIVGTVIPGLQQAQSNIPGYITIVGV